MPPEAHFDRDEISLPVAGRGEISTNDFARRGGCRLLQIIPRWQLTCPLHARVVVAPRAGRRGRHRAVPAFAADHATDIAAACCAADIAADIAAAYHASADVAVACRAADPAVCSAAALRGLRGHQEVRGILRKQGRQQADPVQQGGVGADEVRRVVRLHRRAVDAAAADHATDIAPPDHAAARTP